jgi:hypothetical protein
MDSKLKRAILISAAAGAGVVFAVASIAAGVLWYSSRPSYPKPWNTTALKTEFHYIDTEGTQNTLVFGYYVANQTDMDYQLPAVSALSLMAKRTDNSALSEPQPDYESIDQKLFVPAHQTVSVTIHIAVTPDVKKKDVFGEIDKDKGYRNDLKEWAGKKFENLGGWVLFDKQNRYQVTFPKGW